MNQWRQFLQMSPASQCRLEHHRYLEVPAALAVQGVPAGLAGLETLVVQAVQSGWAL